jgi:hypothetical protein
MKLNKILDVLRAVATDLQCRRPGSSGCLPPHEMSTKGNELVLRNIINNNIVVTTKILT